MKLYNVARMADDTFVTDVLSPHHTHPIGQVLEDLVKENMTVVDTGIKGFRKEAIHANAYVRMQDLVRAFTS